MTSAASRSRRTPATAVLPDAVGPKMASSGGLGRAGGLLVAMRDVARRAIGVLDHGDLLLRVIDPPGAEPLDGALDALLEWHLRLVAEQPPRLRHVGDVVRHLAEQRWSDRDLRIDAQLPANQLRGVQQTVALSVCQVDRAARQTPVRQGHDAPRDAVDAVVDVGEVKRLVLAVDGDRLPS